LMGWDPDTAIPGDECLVQLQLQELLAATAVNMPA